VENKKGTSSHLIGNVRCLTGCKQVPHGLEWRFPVERYGFFPASQLYHIMHPSACQRSGTKRAHLPSPHIRDTIAL
jgi:hypothetical protein